jgi:hypothetical protein
MLIIGVVIGTYKYSFVATIIGFGIIILIGIFAGLLIRIFVE